MDKQYGKFINDADMNEVQKHYHHLLRYHIHNAQHQVIKDTFQFFATTLHFYDGAQEKKQCKSQQRRRERTHDLNANRQVTAARDADTPQTLWRDRQEYMQTTLDMYHSFLCHSDYSKFIKQYDDDYVSDKDDKQEEEDEKSDDLVSDPHDGAGRFVTDAYGFGVQHYHPILAPKYLSMYHELTTNEVHALAGSTVKEMLIKAAQLHEIAVQQYADELFCKHYKEEYGLIRNSKIELRHIFCMVVYTHLSPFCKSFRETYRKMGDETTDEQVQKRHQELYHFSRCLFESLEFFGKKMPPDMKLYHGLNRILYFGEFTAYFNQPVSTTPSKWKARDTFAGGIGIILALKSGAHSDSAGDVKKIPKYLSVAWLSCYPEEEERLFYGESVVFHIEDIVEAASNQSHAFEVGVLNAFQSMLQGENIDWSKKKAESLALATSFIPQRQFGKVTDFGLKLFNHFCRHDSRKNIVFHDIKSHPDEMFKAFFTDTNQNEISLTAVIALLPHMQNLQFKALKINDLERNGLHYLNAVERYAESQQVSVHLKRVSFESETERSRKENAPLKSIVRSAKQQQRFSRLGWTIEYVMEPVSQGMRLSYSHKVVFTKAN